MIQKIGTLQQLNAHRGLIPVPLWQALLQHIAILDEYYGASRDIDLNDGGYALLLENEADIAEVKQSGMIDFSYHVPEYVDLFYGERGVYGIALYLTSNDFGILFVGQKQLLTLLPAVADSIEEE